MSVEAIDFLTCAEKQDRSSEIGRRSAVSRSYYAAFHVVKKHFNQDYESSQKLKKVFGTHKKFITQLKRSDCQIARSIGIKLASAHELRIQSDYLLKVDVDSQHLIKQIAVVKAILQELGYHKA